MAKIVVVTQPNTIVYVSNNDIIEIDIPGGGSITIKAAPGEVVDRFTIHFKGDDQADTANIDLATFSQDNLEINIQHYDPSDTVALIGGFNKGVDPVNEDEFTFSYIGATGNTFNGLIHAKDGGESDFNADPSPIAICFAQGTIIETDLGPRPVESILEDDLVVTHCHGLQPVRWVGRRHLDSLDLARHPQLCPVVVKAGALGDNIPYADLRLSPQHRLHMSDWRAELLFGESEVLVAVKHLVNDTSIYIDRDAASVCYYHLLLDQHEILTANGAPAESLHPGDMALDAIGTDAQSEVHLIFPDISQAITSRRTANMVLKGHEARTVSAYAA